jgi:hypothetical protein
MNTNLKNLIEELVQQELDEFNAIGAGGVSATGGQPLGINMTPQHRVMWSGDKPRKKKKVLPEAMFRGFNMRKFKSLPVEQQWDYVNKFAIPYLGFGVAKDVFAISSGKILKISRYGFDEFGQFKKEIDRSLDLAGTGLVPTIYDYDKDHSSWFVVEPIKQFDRPGQDANMKNITGVSRRNLGTFDTLINTRELGAKNHKVAGEFLLAISQMKGDEVAWSAARAEELLNIYKSNPKAEELLNKYFVLAVHHNVMDIDRADHWGLDANGNIKALDIGV